MSTRLTSYRAAVTPSSSLFLIDVWRLLEPFERVGTNRVLSCRNADKLPYLLSCHLFKVAISPKLTSLLAGVNFWQEANTAARLRVDTLEQVTLNPKP